MAAVSYLQNIDTRPVEYKPYKLPWQGFMQEFSAKNQYFAESAAMVQQSYKNALGLDPLFAQNKEYLKNFMDQANKDLSKIVKSDMTVSDNAVNAANVYKPIFDTSKKENRLLLTDSELNKFYKQEGQKANTARSTKGGAGWNRNNQFYMESQQQKYRQAAERGEDLNTIEDHYAKRKGFIPYYDVLPDLEKIKKLCHEDSSATTKLNKDNYMLFDNTSVSGISSDKMQNCLGFLPDAAKQQIGINSYAQYYGNKEGLMADYKSYFVDKKKDQYDAASLRYTVAAAYTGKDPEKLAQIAELKAQKEEKELEWGNGKSEWSKMIDGQSETDYIENNYDNISSVVGNLKFTERGAKAMSWEEVESKLSVNAAGIAEYKQKGDIYMQAKDFDNAQKMAEQKQGYEQANIALRGQIDMQKALLTEGKTIDKDGKVVPITGGAALSDAEIYENPSEQSFEKFKGELDSAYGAATSAASGLTNAITTYLKDSKVLTDEQKQQWAARLSDPKLIGNDAATTIFMDAYDKLGVKDPMVELMLKKFNSATEKVSNLEDEKNLIEKSITYRKDGVYLLPKSGGGNVKLSTSEIERITNGETINGITKDNFEADTLAYFGNQGKYDKIVVDRLREELHRERFASSTKYFYENLTEKAGKEREYMIKQKLSLPEGYSITPPRIDKDGSAIVQITQEVKDEDGVKSIKTLTESDLKDLNLKNGSSIVNMGGSQESGGTAKETKVSYIKVAGVRAPLSGFINGETQRQLTTFVEGEIKGGIPDGSFSKTPKKITSTTTGKRWKVLVGVVDQNQPVFQLSMESNGSWIKNPTLFQSIEQVLTVIETK